MPILTAFVMLANAVLFFFGAAQHAGIAIGSFQEPTIIPAAIVESLCGIVLACGGVALFAAARKRWWIAVIANAIALSGVLLGIVALALGAGPRTDSNDLYHRAMLALIAASVVMLWLDRRNLNNTSRARTWPAAGAR